MNIIKSEVPFTHWLIDGLFPKEPPPFNIPDNGWTVYDNDAERKWACNKRDLLGPGLNRLFDHLLSESFAWSIQKALDIDIPGLHADATLHGGGIHVCKGGGFLGPHIDYALHPKLDPPMERRLNLILFLVPEWKDVWGGAFELWNDDATEVKNRVYPAPGRAVVWEPTDTAFHGTQAVKWECPMPRVTAAVYYVAPARPGVIRKRALFTPRRS